MLSINLEKGFVLVLSALAILNAVKGSHLDEELSKINYLSSYKNLLSQSSDLGGYGYSNFYYPYPQTLNSLYNIQPGNLNYGSPDFSQNSELLSGIGKTALVAAAGTKTVVGGALAAILLAAAGKAALLSAVGKTALESALEKERLGNLRNFGGQGYFSPISYPTILYPHNSHQVIFGFEPDFISPHGIESQSFKLNGQDWGKEDLKNDHYGHKIYGHVEGHGHVNGYRTRGHSLQEFYGRAPHDPKLHEHENKDHFGHGYGNYRFGHRGDKIGALEHFVKKTTKGVVRAAFSELREK